MPQSSVSLERTNAVDLDGDDGNYDEPCVATGHSASLTTILLEGLSLPLVGGGFNAKQ